MRLNNFLNELFQERKDWKIDEARDDGFIAKFEVGTKTWTLSAEFVPSYARYNGWEIVLLDEKEQYNLTGLAGENAIEVYSYVVSILKYFISNYGPKLMYFDGFDPKQHKFYQKLIKRFSKELKKSGYEIRLGEDIIKIYKEE